MKKSVFLKVILLISVVLLAFAISGCTSDLPDGYVEVESLRIADATIYLSPSGDTAKYQLEVEILPENATNVGLTYFIPSQYLEYVTVDSDGLITAKLEPEDDISIPLTVTSTTNKKAKLVLALIIEYIEVDEITFDQSDLELKYNGESVQLSVSYTPYHAQDGRNVTYASLNADVASVSTAGVLSPVSAGHATITAVGKTMAGKEITAYLHVTVSYEQSDFKLEVSDASPKYKQTVSSPQYIAFTLLSLEPDADPNPRIQWYVGSEKVNGIDGQTQYRHIPTASTSLSYKITVKVKCIGEAEQSFQSETIYIYNDFTGFEFLVDNESSVYDNHLYGDTATFEITSTGYGIDHFDWYLKRIGQDGNGMKVGITTGASPDLTKVLNLDGDFTLTAKGYSSSDEYMEGSQQTFNFNVTRYVVGDTITLTPEVKDDGIPPESYNWYLYKYNDQGTIIGSGLALSDNLSNVVIVGNTLYYTMTSDENIIILAKGMLEGKVATVLEDGIVTEFIEKTDIIKICPVNYAEVSTTDDIVDGNDKLQLDYAINTNTTIYDVIIDGVYEIGVYTPLVYWSAVGATNTYYVEVTKETTGEVLLLNSTESSKGGNYFGDYYCKLPTDFVTLNDQFKVRIKQKGGQYTQYYYYGYTAVADSDISYFFDIIDDTQYGYLLAFTDVVDNGYIRSLKELGAIVDYIFLYEPSFNTNSLITVTNNVNILMSDNTIVQYDRKYALKIYLDLDFDDYEEYYPINQNYTIDELYENLYKSIAGIQNAYCETSVCELNMSYDETDGGYMVYLYKDLNSTDLISTTEVEENTTLSEHYASVPYGSSNSIFDINYKTVEKVYTSDQLYNAAEAGKLPVAQTTQANLIFNKAKAVINDIIGEGMTDTEKVLAIYDWLILNIEYDNETLNITNATDFSGFAYDYEAFHLEGVFESHKAVCDGIAKAMSLLCWIEGIPCYKVSGKANGTGHAWNKVLIDGKWYVVDATWGGTSGYINYKFFMMTDSEFISYHTVNNLMPSVYGEYEAANTSYNYYINTFINGHDTYVESIEEFTALVNSYGDTLDGDKTLQVRLSASLLADYNNNLSNVINEVQATVTGNKTIDSNILALSYDVIVITLKST